MPSTSAHSFGDGEAELFPPMDMNLAGSLSADLRPTIRHYKVYRPNNTYGHQDDLFPKSSEPMGHSSPPESLRKLSSEETGPLRDEIDHAFFGRESSSLPLTMQNRPSSRGGRFPDSIDHLSKPSISTTMSSGQSSASIRSGKSHASSVSTTNTLTKSSGKLSVKEVEPFETNFVQNGSVYIPPKKINRILNSKREPAFPKRTVVRPGRSPNFWFDGPEGQISSDEEDGGSEPNFKKSRVGQELNSRLSSAPDSRPGSFTSFDSSTHSIPRAADRHVTPLNCPLSVQNHRQSIENQDSGMDSEVAPDNLSVSGQQATRSDAGSMYSVSSSHSRNAKHSFTDLNHESILNLSSSEDDTGNELRSSDSYPRHLNNDTSRIEDSETTVIASKQQKKLNRRSSTGSHMAAAVQRPSFIPVISRRSSASGPLNAPRGRQYEPGSVPPYSAVPQKYSAGQFPPTTRLRKLRETEEKTTDAQSARPTTPRYGQTRIQQMPKGGSSEREVTANHNTNGVAAHSQRIPYDVLLELVRHTKDAVPEQYLREIVKKSRESVCFDDLVAAAQTDFSRMSVEDEETAPQPIPQKSARRLPVQQNLSDNSNSNLRSQRERRPSTWVPQNPDINAREEQLNKAIQKLGPPPFMDRPFNNHTHSKPPRKPSHSSLSSHNTESKQPRRPSTSDQRSRFQHSSSEQSSQPRDTSSRRHKEQGSSASSKRSIFSRSPKPSCHKLKDSHSRSNKDTADNKLQPDSRKNRSLSIGTACKKPDGLKPSQDSAQNDYRSRSSASTSRSPSLSVESFSRPPSNRSGSPHSMMTTSSQANSLSPATALASVSQKPPRTPRLRARYKFSPRLLQPPLLSPNTEANDLANSGSQVPTVRDVLLNLPTDKSSAPPSLEPSIISDCYRSESSGTQESIGINEAGELTIITSSGPQHDQTMDDSHAYSAVWSIHERRPASSGKVCH